MRNGIIFSAQLMTISWPFTFQFEQRILISRLSAETKESLKRLTQNSDLWSFGLHCTFNGPVPNDAHHPLVCPRCGRCLAVILKREWDELLAAHVLRTKDFEYPGFIAWLAANGCWDGELLDQAQRRYIGEQEALKVQ